MAFRRRSPAPAVVDPLATGLTALGDEDPDVREKAVATLVASGDVERLVAFLHEHRFDDATVRVEAAQALGAIGDPRAIDVLLDMGRRVEESGRHRDAANALGAIGAPAFDRVLGLSNSKVAVDQALAARALGGSGDLRAVRVLATFVQRGRPRHPQPFVRHEAHRALVALTGEDVGEDKDAWMAWLEAEVPRQEEVGR